MSAPIQRPAAGSQSADYVALKEIIELGRKVLRQRRAEEFASDLLGLDGVMLPLDRPRGID